MSFLTYSCFKVNHTIHYVYTIHYTLCTIHYTLYTIHYTLYTIHSTFHTLYTIHYTLYTIHYTLYTIHYTLYTIHLQVLKTGSSGKTTAMRMMPLAKRVPTPSERIKGLHYHTLQLEGVATVTAHVALCEIDEAYEILATSQLEASSAVSLTTLHNTFLFSSETVELAWKQADVVLLFSFKSRGRLVAWSYVKYSDRAEQVEVFKPPLPSFSELIEVRLV